MPRKPKFNDDQRKVINEKYRTGTSAAKLKKEYKTSLATIYKIVNPKAGGSLADIRKELVSARAEVQRLEKLLADTSQREQMLTNELLKKPEAK